MVDRINDIWGERTPHPRGTVWPARVDQHLEDGLAEQDVDRWVQLNPEGAAGDAVYPIPLDVLP